MDYLKIKTFGELKKSNWISKSIKDEMRDNLISKYSTTGELKLHYSDLLDPSSLNTLVQSISPDEIYNLAAQSHVMVSFENPMFTSQTGTIGSLSLLEAIRYSDKEIKFAVTNNIKVIVDNNHDFK